MPLKKASACVSADENQVSATILVVESCVPTRNCECCGSMTGRPLLALRYLGHISDGTNHLCRVAMYP